MISINNKEDQQKWMDFLEESGLHYDQTIILCDKLKNELDLMKEKYEEESSKKEKENVYLKNILNIIPAGIVLLDKNGDVDYLNKTASDLFSKEIKGLKWNEVASQELTPDSSNNFYFKTKNKKTISLSTQSLDSLVGQIIILWDQTDAISEEEKKNHQEKINSLGTMMSVLAHQIRTPLASCLMYAFHLKNSNLDENKINFYKSNVYDLLKNIESQVNNILMFSRSGQTILENCSIEDIFITVLKSIESETRKKDVKIYLNSDEKTKNIKANKDSMIWVFVNLILNAIQSKEDNIEIKIDIKNESGFIVFYIEDNGPGISKDLIEKIKTPFFTTKKDGTGLGLAVVDSIIRSHEGTFEIIDSLEGGLKIKIKIPFFDEKTKSEVESSSLV